MWLVAMISVGLLIYAVSQLVAKGRYRQAVLVIIFLSVWTLCAAQREIDLTNAVEYAILNGSTRVYVDDEDYADYGVSDWLMDSNG